MSSHYPEGTAHDPMAPWNDDPIDLADLDPDELEQIRLDGLIDLADAMRKGEW